MQIQIPTVGTRYLVLLNKTINNDIFLSLIRVDKNIWFGIILIIVAFAYNYGVYLYKTILNPLYYLYYIT